MMVTSALLSADGVGLSEDGSYTASAVIISYGASQQQVSCSLSCLPRFTAQFPVPRVERLHIGKTSHAS